MKIIALVFLFAFIQQPDRVQFTGVNYDTVKKFCPKVKKVNDAKFPHLILIEGKDTLDVWPMFWIIKKGGKYSVKDPYK